MGFNFGFPAVDNGQLDPSTQAMIASMASPPAANPQASAPQPAPQPQQQQASPQGLPDIKVSPLEAVASWLAHGGTPAEAAQGARAVKIKNLMDAIALQQAQQRYGLSQQLGARDQLDYLTNPGEWAKSDAKNVEPQSVAPNNTVLYRGGAANPGGAQYRAPGTFSVSPTGAVVNDGRGVVGNVSLPQTAGGRIYPFMPGYNQPGAGAPASGWTTYGQPPPQGGPMAGQQQTSSGQPQAQKGGLDPIGFFKSFVLPHEGGLNPHDMNGAPTKYGINQAANPGVNVANLKPDDAAKIFATKYYGPSGAANMPPALAAVHADTYFINPKMAQTFLQQSGGDPNAYLGLRNAWMSRLVQTNPKAAPYAAAWSQRNQDLAQFVAQQGSGQQGGGQPPQAGPQSAPTQIGAPTGQGPRILSPQEAQAAGFAPGAVVEQAPDGKLSVTQSPEYGPDAKSNLRNHVLGSDEYKQAQAGLAAYHAMVANASRMTGPSAYSMLDTFARAINPGAVARPTVIQTIEQNLGLPAQLVGGLESKFGQGNLPREVRQQIIDAVVPFVQTHWDQANSLNQANVAQAHEHKLPVGDVTAPLEARPQRMIVGPTGAMSEADAVAQARQAIRQGAPRASVIQRLQSMRINPAGL